MLKFLVISGIVSLMHCGYSAVLYRSHLRLTEKEFTGLPFDITLQALLSLLVSLLGIIQLCNGFKEIRALDGFNSKTLDTIENRPSFYTFRHRGRLLNFY